MAIESIPHSDKIAVYLHPKTLDRSFEKIENTTCLK